MVVMTKVLSQYRRKRNHFLSSKGGTDAVLPTKADSEGSHPHAGDQTLPEWGRDCENVPRGDPEDPHPHPWHQTWKVSPLSFPASPPTGADAPAKLTRNRRNPGSAGGKTLASASAVQLPAWKTPPPPISGTPNTKAQTASGQSYLSLGSVRPPEPILAPEYIIIWNKM